MTATHYVVLHCNHLGCKRTWQGSGGRPRPVRKAAKAVGGWTYEPSTDPRRDGLDRCPDHPARMGR